MQITIRNIGNSKGVVLPKALLAQAGLDGSAQATVTVKDGAIILSKPVPQTRAGWSKAAAAIASAGSDALLMGEFGNDADTNDIW